MFHQITWVFVENRGTEEEEENKGEEGETRVTKIHTERGRDNTGSCLIFSD